MMPLFTLSPPEQPWHSSRFQSLPKVYVQNASLEIAWARVVFQEHTIAGNVFMPFFTYGWEGFDLNDLKDWRLAEQSASAGEARLPEVRQPDYPPLNE